EPTMHDILSPMPPKFADAMDKFRTQMDQAWEVRQARGNLPYELLRSDAGTACLGIAARAQRGTPTYVAITAHGIAWRAADGIVEAVGDEQEPLNFELVWQCRRPEGLTVHQLDETGAVQESLILRAAP